MAPKPIACEEKQRLTGAFLDAFRDLVTLHDSEMGDLVAGGAGLQRSNLALQRARQRRDDARAALLRHVRAHGC